LKASQFFGGKDAFFASRCRVFGRGERTLLFFNGASLPMAFWRPIAESLSADYRVIMFDQRNAGATKFEGDFTLADVARDASQLLHKLEIKQVVAIGHAWGGRVAQIFARDYPEFMQAMIVCGTGGQLPAVDMSEVQAELSAARKAGNRDVWGACIAKMFCAEGFTEDHPAQYEDIVELMWTHKPNRNARWNMGAIPSDEYWGLCTQPTLLIYGAEDKNGTPENADDLHRRIEQSKLVTIKGAGHFAIREKEREVVEKIRLFLSSLP
jgi:pimeloyl-ACP methyl ester carboxylesterase